MKIAEVTVGTFWSSKCGHTLTFQGMTGRLKWPQEEWKVNIAEVDSMMLLVDVKLKNNHTSLKRGC